ncbi:MAG: BrnT family toxin [Lachnospiraceae bacterium]|nr:BrnT family toxin [Lachnospiraceae bacterium]
MRDDVIYLDRFVWNREKAKTNIEKHRVSFEVAARIFNDPVLYIEYDEINSTPAEERYHCTGMVAGALMVLRVTMTEREPYIRLISARKATRKEISDYEKNFKNL